MLGNVDHVIEGLLLLVLVFYGYLPFGVLDWGNGGISPHGVGPRHVANGIERASEHLLQGNFVLGHCFQRVGWLSQAGVRATICRGFQGRFDPCATE